MQTETLEERMYKHERPKLLDSLMSAYSSSKAVKLGLAAIASGYTYYFAAALSGAFYLAAKTAAIAAKNIVNFVFNPISYFKNITKNFYDAVEFYRPFGRYTNSTILGGTLSTVTHYTGF